jgi:hypothetical protein
MLRVIAAEGERYQLAGLVVRALRSAWVVQVSAGWGGGLGSRRG